MTEQILTTNPDELVDVTVTDFDPVMVAAASDRLQGFGARAHAQVADATALPFEDGSFDTVVSFIMLHHVIDWERALAEAPECSRPAECWSATTCSAAHRRGCCTTSKGHRTGSSPVANSACA